MSANPNNINRIRKNGWNWKFGFAIAVAIIIAVVAPFFLAFLLFGGFSISNVKDSAQIEQSLFAIVAVIAAAAWYLQRRKRYPRANLT